MHLLLQSFVKLFKTNTKSQKSNSSNLKILVYPDQTLKNLRKTTFQIAFIGNVKKLLYPNEYDGLKWVKQLKIIFKYASQLLFICFTTEWKFLSKISVSVTL